MSKKACPTHAQVCVQNLNKYLPGTVVQEYFNPQVKFKKLPNGLFEATNSSDIRSAEDIAKAGKVLVYHRPHISVSPEQAAYVAYHSPEQRAARMEVARRDNEAAVSDAHRLFFSGDATAAEDRLFSVGISAEGILYYLNSWGSESS